MCISSRLLLVSHGSAAIHIYQMMHDDIYFTELKFFECQSHDIMTMHIYLDDDDDFIKDGVL